MLKFAIAATLLATAMPALAQSADDTSWTGFYAGGRMGYSFQPGDGDERTNFDTNLDGQFNNEFVRTAAGANAFSPGFCGGQAKTTNPADGCKKDGDSLEWALHAGFDYDLGGFVVGALVEGGVGYADDSVSSYSTTPAYYTMTRRMRENVGVRGRAGYAFGSNRDTLVYGTGGVVWAKMKNKFETSNTANSFTLSGDESVMGYRAGGGVEHRVAKNLSIGVQYLFTSLKDDGARVRVGPGTAPATNPFRLVNSNGTDFSRSHSRFVTHNIGATANFRF